MSDIENNDENSSIESDDDTINEHKDDEMTDSGSENNENDFNDINITLGFNDIVEDNVHNNLIDTFIDLLRIPLVQLTNEEMTNINNRAIEKANNNINSVYTELIDIEKFELLESIINSSFGIYNLIAIFVEKENLSGYNNVIDSLKYIYTYLLFYRDYLIQYFKQHALQFLIDYYKNIEITTFINLRIERQQEDVKIILSEEDFNNLSIIKYDDLKDHLDCGICLTEYEKEDEIIKLECSHCYHKDCIKQQLCQYSSKCPTCKMDVKGGKPNI
jgi:hypothetical protein